LTGLLVRPDVRLVVLFGSVAEGRQRPDSDLDLGVLRDGPGSNDDVELLVMQLLGTERVDVVDLRRAPPLLAMAVAKTGVVLYDSPEGAFARYASLALRRYEDTAKLRRARAEGLRRFIAERGA
jgi:predicted nucleotidyltransferase